MPLLHSCVECGRPVALKGRVCFGHVDGGVLCQDCRGGRKNIVSADAGALRTMEQLAQADSRIWQRLEIAPKIGGQIRGLLDSYISHLMGRKPRMQAWLKS